MKIWKQYQDNILNDKIPANKYLKTICRKLHNDLEQAKKAEYPYYFDENVIDKILIIVNELSHIKGDLAGERISLEPWQVWLLANIYGWKHKNNHKRRFKYIYLFTGKGNGKTIIDSIVLTLDLLFNRGGEGIVVANRKEQAKLAFENIKAFIQNSDILRTQLSFTTYAIYNKSRLNNVKAVAGRAEGLNGKNLSVAVIDEIAEVKSYEVYNNIVSSCSKRSEYLVLMTTTAQPNTDSIGYDEYRKSIKILEGVIDDEEYLPVLYQLDLEDDWRNVNTYIKANPNLDISIKKEELEKKRKNAVAGIQTDELQLRTLHLNQWVFNQEDLWIPTDKWEQNEKNIAKYKHYISEENLKNYLCVGGLDLSIRNDLSVYTLAFWIPEIRKIYLKHRMYVPKEEVARKMKNDSYLFFKWIKEGYITAIDGAIIRNDVIVNDILEDKKKYKIKEMAYDKQFLDDESKEVLAKHMDIIEIKQTTEYLSKPTSAFFNNAMIGTFIDNNPVMKWCISNVEIERNNMGIKVRKEYVSSSRRVDAVITSIMALLRLQYYIRIQEKKGNVDVNKLSTITY